MARSMFPTFAPQNDFQMLGSPRRLPHLLSRSPSSAGRTHWNAERTSHRGASLHPGADQAAGDLRRPGRDRHRERAVVPRTGGADRELARSVGELKALGEVGQAVSSTLDLQTVLSTIVGHAVQLSGTDCGVIYEYDEATQEFHLRASYRMEEELVKALQVNTAPSRGKALLDKRRRSVHQFKCRTF